MLFRGRENKFEHDCTQCEYMGSTHDDENAPAADCAQLDTYWCPNARSGGSIIVRHSSEPSDYHSMPVSTVLGAELLSPDGKISLKIAQYLLHSGKITIHCK